VRRNVKGQRYALDNGTFVNYAEILGDKLYMTARGNFDDAGPATMTTTTMATSRPNADSAKTDDDVSQYSVRYEYLLWARPAKARR